MMKLRQVLLLLFLAVATILDGQYTKEFKRIFFDADYLYETSFYEQAFSRYKNLLTLDPGNHNILFHCGACCLNIKGKEADAITYLEQAAPGVTADYKDKSHKETGAPVMAYFMLGQAYHMKYQFPEAIDNYQQYLDNTKTKDQVQLAYTETQIEACVRASQVDLDRPDFEFQNVLDHFDKDLPSSSNPVISGDGKLLIFLVDYPADKKIMMTTLEGGYWTRPRVINNEIGMVGETYPVSLSYDGKDLYLAHHYYSHSDIFVSHSENGVWSEAQPLGYNINGKTSETHASISKDGNTLYFTSDVRGGQGSFDIYVSKKNPKGEWGVPKNLGGHINTSFEEHTPFISGNDSILFFSSQGHTSLGGMDIFYSIRQEDGSWGEALNMGYPVNTPADDVFFNPGWNEIEGYYAVPKTDDPTAKAINIVMQIEYPEEIQAEMDMPDTTDFTIEELEAAEVSLEPVPEREMLGIKSTAYVSTAPAAGSFEKALEPEDTDSIVAVLNPNIPETKVPDIAETVPVPVPVHESVSNNKTIAIMNERGTALPFDFNEFELNMAATLLAEQLVHILESYPNLQVEISGNTDSKGSSAYNRLLSEQRAEQVASFLEARGIDRKRMTVMGKGESAPLARNRYSDGSDAPLGRYLNRQVRVMLKGEMPTDLELGGLFVPAHLEKTDMAGVDLSEYAYTIQLMACLKAPANMSAFSGLEEVKEFHCSDGYHRYTIGDFRNFSDAREMLQKMHKLGFEGAYIQTQEWYMRHLR